MNMRLRVYEYCHSNLGAIYAKGLCHINKTEVKPDSFRANKTKNTTATAEYPTDWVRHQLLNRSAHIAFLKIFWVQNISLMPLLISVLTSTPKKRFEENLHTKKRRKPSMPRLCKQRVF